MRLLINFLILICFLDLSAQKNDYSGFKFIRPFKCFIEGKAKQIDATAFKYEMTEFGQVICSSDYIENNLVKKCGIISSSGEFILPKIFNSISILDTLAFVNLNSSHSVYNLKSKKWLKSFDRITFSDYNSNYFIVSKNDEYFLLDKKCNEVFHKSGYELYTLINDDLIIVKNQMTQLYGVYNIKNKKLIIDDKFTSIKMPFMFNAFIVSDHRLNYIYNLYGQQVTKDKYIDYHHYHRTDICAFQTLKNEIKIIKSNGKEIDKKLQDSLLSTVFKYFKGKNIEGKKNLFENRFSTESRKHFYIAMNSDGKYGIYNSHYNTVLPFEYDYIEYSGNKIYVNKGEQFELFEITKDTFQSIRSLKEGRIFSNVCGTFISSNGLFDAIGNKLSIPYPIKNIKRILYDKSLKETYVIQDRTGKWSFYLQNQQSNFIKYDKITSYNEVQANNFQPLLYLNVCKNDIWGLCDLKGNEIVNPMFDDIIRTDDVYLIVKKGKKYGIYTVQSNTLSSEDVKSKSYIFPPEYDFIMFVSPYKYYAEKDGEQFYLTF